LIPVSGLKRYKKIKSRMSSAFGLRITGIFFVYTPKGAVGRGGDVGGETINFGVSYVLKIIFK